MTEPNGGGRVRPPVRPAAARSASRRRPRRKVTLVGVLGELLITAGVLVLLFLGWQLWFNDLVVDGQLEAESSAQQHSWSRDKPTTTPVSADDPPVPAVVGHAQTFALLIVPRFGADYIRPIAEGTGTTDVLNTGRIGHYPSSQMPGEIGNFAIAAHRMAYGRTFERNNELVIGDHIFVETHEGWYQYSFRNLEFVKANGVGVVAPVPQSTAAPTQRLLTMTTCNPKWTWQERIIAYSVFDTFYPRADGPPSEIAATVAAAS
ncbi:MAG TPA: class E sortase [Pseudolysinimonas sp.]|nr:class E sortase [Pseudolysinimonas sp.]